MSNSFEAEKSKVIGESEMREAALVISLISIIISVLVGLFIFAVKLAYVLIGVAWMVLCGVVKGSIGLVIMIKRRVSLTTG